MFALLASYFFSRTIIPTLVMFLLPKEVEQHRHSVAGIPLGRFARLHQRFEHGFEALRDRYGASFSTLREALSRLVAEGLVTSEEHRGFVVVDG